MSDSDEDVTESDVDEVDEEGGSISGETVVKKQVKRELPKFKTIEEIEVSRFNNFVYDIFEDKYTPLALDLSDMQLTDIYPITLHPYLTYLKLVNNNLTNGSLDCLSLMPNIVSLYLNNNQITSTTIPQMEKLQQLNFENNPIDMIDPIDQPNLEILILNKTKINELQYIGLHSTPKLQTLSATYCNLKKMIADYALTMTSLFLGYNQIKRIEGLSGLVNLKILHLRHNRVSKLTGLTVGLERLEYLNLRENEVIDPKELKKIKTLPSLRVIILTDTPLDDEMGSDIRPMALMYSLELKRINKQLTDDDDVAYARSLMYQVEAETEGILPAEVLLGEGE